MINYDVVYTHYFMFECTSLTCILNKLRDCIKTAYFKSTAVSLSIKSAICQTKRNIIAWPNPVNAAPRFPIKAHIDRRIIIDEDAVDDIMIVVVSSQI